MGHKIALCPKCFSKITFLPELGCPRCGRSYEFSSDNGTVCPQCLNHPPRFRSLRSAFIYKDTSKELILHFKHADRIDMVPFLGNLIYQSGKSVIENTDIILAVPLHLRKLIKRKYNQSGLLAHYLAKRSGKKFLANTLIRKINTKSQGHDNIHQRYKNVHNAFLVKNPHAICGKNIVLVDDVYTTGATLNECAKELYKAGAKAVDALTIARVHH